MTIDRLKKELGLTNADLAKFLGLKPENYATSSAKRRYEKAFCAFYLHVKNKTK